MRFALKKTVPFTNLGRKSDKYKNRARDMIEKIAFHMLHVPSKPPQFWSADFLQNYPLFNKRLVKNAKRNGIGAGNPASTNKHDEIKVD